MPTHAQSATQTAPIPTDGTLLSVSAQAEARRVPDVATISAGVVTQAADANAAMRDNADADGQGDGGRSAAGIAERDIQTSRHLRAPAVQVRARTSRRRSPATRPATRSTSRSRDIGKLGKVLDALVASGANQINGPTFDVDKPRSRLRRSPPRRLEKAKARAETYAKTLGLRVRRIVSITEGGGFGPPARCR